MLEDLALRYAEVPEDQMRLIGYGLTILGGIIGGLTYRSSNEIRRAHYFALSGLIFLCVAVVTFGGMAFIVEALAGGIFWFIVATELMASVVGGFFLARIASDRSRDAYRHGRMGCLGVHTISEFLAAFYAIEDRDLGQPRTNDPIANGWPWSTVWLCFARCRSWPFDLCPS